MKKIYPTIAILIFLILWVFPGVQKYRWAGIQDKLISKQLPRDRFQLYETINNNVEVYEPWTWFYPPIHTLKYADTESILSFIKDEMLDNPDCLIWHRCSYWTIYRFIMAYRNEDGTNISEWIGVIDCKTGKGGFYDSDKKRFRFVEKDIAFSKYNSFFEPSKIEHEFICSKAAGQAAKEITLHELEQQLSSWQPIDL